MPPGAGQPIASSARPRRIPLPPLPLRAFPRSPRWGGTVSVRVSFPHAGHERGRHRPRPLRADGSPGPRSWRPSVVAEQDGLLRPLHDGPGRRRVFTPCASRRLTGGLARSPRPNGRTRLAPGPAPGSRRAPRAVRLTIPSVVGSAPPRSPLSFVPALLRWCRCTHPVACWTVEKSAGVTQRSGSNRNGSGGVVLEAAVTQSNDNSKGLVTSRLAPCDPRRWHGASVSRVPPQYEN